MFTGLIEEIGTIKKISKNSNGMNLTVLSTISFLKEVKTGDSIAVNGVCLTAETVDSEQFTAYVSNETLSKATFGENIKINGKVNLEKPMKPDSFLGGHIVQGHVDTTGTIGKIVNNGNGWDIFIRLSDINDMVYVVEKGSISVDGVSLTINEILSDQFRLTIIPHTFNNTIMKFYKIGDKVNLEFDIIAKYVFKMLNNINRDEKITELINKSSYFK